MPDTEHHATRVWNYLLGGTDNHEPDRHVGDLTCEVLPQIAALARESRAYLTRVVETLAGPAGPAGPCQIRQFIDIGAGLPTAGNTHEVAQRVAPESRIVYVDNDPLVARNSCELLTSAPEGGAGYMCRDLRSGVDSILDEAGEQLLDLRYPVAVILIGVAEYLTQDELLASLTTLRARLAPGSYIALSAATADYSGDQMRAAINGWSHAAQAPMTTRTWAEFTQLVDRSGLWAVAPGLLPMHLWRLGGSPGEQVDAYAGVGIVPE